jgi:hypothetical protein
MHVNMFLLQGNAQLNPQLKWWVSHTVCKCTYSSSRAGPDGAFGEYH